MTFSQFLANRLRRPPHGRVLPRRRRRGFSIAEMALVLIVLALIMQTGIEVATAYTKRQVTQQTAARLSRVADDVQTYLDRNYFEIRSELEADGDSTLEKDWTTLISSNRISLDSEPVSPDGGVPRLFFTLKGGDTVYAVILSVDGADNAYSPKPDPAVRFAGKVDGNRPDTLTGYDFSLQIPEIRDLAGGDIVNTIGVMRYVSAEVSVDPYLHRQRIPGRPELNRMNAPLDMGGFDIVGTNNIETGTMDVQDELNVAGTLTTQDLVSSGDADLDEITAANAIEADGITARNAEVRGTVEAREIVSETTDTGSLVAISGTFNQLAAGDFDADQVYFAEGNFINVNAQSVDADLVIADEVITGD